MTLSDLIERETGSRNWVVARRTKRILRQYGEDVVTLSSKRLAQFELQFELETASQHPAIPLLRQWTGACRDASDLIWLLRKAGFRIERIGPRDVTE